MPRTSTPTSLPALIGVRELCELWGFKQARTVRQWAQDGRLGPVYDLGGQIRVERDRAAAFLRSNQISRFSESVKEAAHG